MTHIAELLNILGDFSLFVEGAETHLVGFLTEREGNIVLECRVNNNPAKLLFDKTTYQIWGRVASSRVTMTNCSVTRGTLYGSDYCEGTVSFTPHEIIVGCCTKDEIMTTVISTSITELNRMYLDRLLNPRFNFSKDNPSVLDINFPDAIHATDPDGTLNISRTFSINYPHNQVNFQIIPYIEFRFSQPVELHKAIAKITSVRNLFTFFADYYLPFGEFKFATTQTDVSYGESFCDCELHLNFVEDIKTQDRPFLICTDAFAPSFQSIWDNWQAFNNDAKHIVALFSEIIGDHSRRTNRFLNLCQCLEVYSVRYRNSYAKQIYKKYNPDKDKDPTLKHRLEDLFLSVNKYLNIKEDKCAELAQIISNARNFFTHYSRRTEPSFECIAYSCELLHYVLLLIVYNALGIPDKNILDCGTQGTYKNMNVFISKII